MQALYDYTETVWGGQGSTELIPDLHTLPRISNILSLPGKEPDSLFSSSELLDVVLLKSNLAVQNHPQQQKQISFLFPILTHSQICLQIKLMESL